MRLEHDPIPEGPAKTSAEHVSKVFLDWLLGKIGYDRNDVQRHLAIVQENTSKHCYLHSTLSRIFFLLENGEREFFRVERLKRLAQEFALDFPVPEAALTALEKRYERATEAMREYEYAASQVWKANVAPKLQPLPEHVSETDVPDELQLLSDALAQPSEEDRQNAVDFCDEQPIYAWEDPPVGDILTEVKRNLESVEEILNYLTLSE